MSPSSELPFDVQQQDEEVVLNLSRLRILDETAVQSIRESLLHLADDHTGRLLIVDFIGVEYLGSAMLETLLNMHRKMKAGGGRFVLRHLQPQVYEVFQVTKLDELFEIQKEA
jgi:anti-sigma B factor antagonist